MTIDQYTHTLRFGVMLALLGAVACFYIVLLLYELKGEPKKPKNLREINQKWLNTTLKKSLKMSKTQQ